MSPSDVVSLSRREQQIMDIVYASGEATVSQVLERLPDPPSYSAVRALLNILKEKGHLKHRRESVRYVYLPTQRHQQAGQSALKRALQTFFSGNIEQAVVALLNVSDTKMSPEEIERVTKLIDKAKKQGC